MHKKWLPACTCTTAATTRMVLDTSNNQGKRHQPYLRLPREDRSPTATPQYLLRDTTLDVVEEFSSRESKRGVHRTCARTCLLYTSDAADE